MYYEYEAKERGITWTVYESKPYEESKPLLHNLQEWQAKAIAAILNNK